MKTQNTLENKAKFFAHYLGCEVVYPEINGKLIKCKLHGVSFSEIETTYKRKRKGCVGDILSFESNGNHKSDAINAYLELKPISHISDEDAINLGYGYVSHLKSNLDRNIDQLRNLGYALPYMDLSVEDLIEYGWIKLKEN